MVGDCRKPSLTKPDNYPIGYFPTRNGRVWD